ncbi:MAG: hypothetical protein CVV10_03425 [Gammaproteobacteria bacterium HGW-Gammaproteobacteria-14]|nr:MAG: hypothetical protein CVV10_03425 [Gammaproteobacteria bacterium HGW-Gammaproteobacteria-14]
MLLTMLMLVAQTLLAWHAPSHLHDGTSHYGSHSETGHHGTIFNEVFNETSNHETSNSDTHNCPLGINSHGTAACDSSRDMQATRPSGLFLHNNIAALCEPLYCGTLPRGPPLNS